MSMNIAITGANGFIGSALTAYLSRQGHKIIIITRKDIATYPDINPQTLYNNKIDKSDCIINLAGENIFCRWTKRVKKRILLSRTLTTSKIVECLNKFRESKIFISASAIGYYGEGKSDEYIFSKGDDFLSSVCEKWEIEAQKCIDIHRKLIVRFGIVLDKSGGALKQMRLP